MPTIQKLRQNLAQSEGWSHGFKEEIKRLMEEISAKNEQIASMSRWNLDAKQQIQKGQAQLKIFLEDKQRNVYKKDKLQIKINQLQSRITVYQDAVAKKSEWNQELKKKIKIIQKTVEQQQSLTAIDQIFDGISQSKISISSFSSNSDVKSQKSSIKNSSIHPKIDTNLTRLKNLQIKYHQLALRCKQKEEQLQRQRKIERRLKQSLKQLNEENSYGDKENMLKQSNSNPIEELSKKTRGEITRVKELQDRNNSLKLKIQQERAWISKYSKYVEALASCENQTESIRTFVVGAQREAKKEKKAIETICSFVLRQEIHDP